MSKKKHIIKYLDTGKIDVLDDNNDHAIFTAKDFIKSGLWGREKQYKYFCEHPEEIEDQKLFSELEKEFGEKDDNI